MSTTCPRALYGWIGPKITLCVGGNHHLQVKGLAHFEYRMNGSKVAAKGAKVDPEGGCRNSGRPTCPNKGVTPAVSGLPMLCYRMDSTA